MEGDAPASHADLAEVAAEVRSLTRTVAAALADGRTHSGGHATISVNAGGVGLWVAVTCAAIMFAVNACLLVAGALWLGRIDRENSEHGHQLNAIYMLAPHLKPKKEAPPP